MNKQINNPGQANHGYSIPIYMDPIRDSCNVDLMVAVYDYYCRQNRSYDLKRYIGAIIRAGSRFPSYRGGYYACH